MYKMKTGYSFVRRQPPVQPEVHPLHMQQLLAPPLPPLQPPTYESQQSLPAIRVQAREGGSSLGITARDAGWGARRGVSEGASVCASTSGAPSTSHLHASVTALDGGRVNPESRGASGDEDVYGATGGDGVCAPTPCAPSAPSTSHDNTHLPARKRERDVSPRDQARQAAHNDFLDASPQKRSQVKTFQVSPKKKSSSRISPKSTLLDKSQSNASADRTNENPEAGTSSSTSA